MDTKWQFWIDRGGTFTDVVAKDPSGTLHTKKLLSENPDAYDDAALAAIREFLGVTAGGVIPADKISALKMGTTVATNALLERKGERTLLAVTKGLGDILEIGYQTRPKVFALNIEKPSLLYSDVVEIDERILADGTVDKTLDTQAAQRGLKAAYNTGYRSIAIVLMHAYRYSAHEVQLAEIAHKIGFTQISTSHEVSPLIRIVSRGDTTVVDAYLTPILRRYVERISGAIGGSNTSRRILFMQSSGGLTSAEKFHGRDAILSGPAGGIVGAVCTSKLAGFDKIIGFDMGGTSTDVSHYAGDYERAYETEVAGVRMRVPMMDIHTVAAGGGSIVSYENNRFLVGPESAGANPGPACYRNGGPLAVTDINVCLGKIHPDFFPHIFGPDQNQPLDRSTVITGFNAIASTIGDGRSAEDVAEGFLKVAIEHMAQAVKKISIERGYNVKQYTLTSFGGAGGQHACLVAERLGMKRVFLHPYSGVLSAYGMGLADIRSQRQQVFEKPLSDSIIKELDATVSKLREITSADLAEQLDSDVEQTSLASVFLRYSGTDTALLTPHGALNAMQSAFEAAHKRQFGFISPEKSIIIETVSVESHGGSDTIDEQAQELTSEPLPDPLDTTKIYSGGKWFTTPLYDMAALKPGHSVQGPAIIVEPNGTIIVEPSWSAVVTKHSHLVLERSDSAASQNRLSTIVDPVMLEIFNNLFMSIAEQMGIVLRNTSSSVNIKERLDFSCAIFDAGGNLIANAPHMPVHLGSMDASVKVVINSGIAIKGGDVFIHNNPYDGGSHLPDITVITPVFDAARDTGGDTIAFYLGSRAHHADVGGITPGSMPPTATSISQEGVVINCMKMVSAGTFLEAEITELLSSGEYPARNIDQNIADLKAQIAANNKGALELANLTASYGTDIVHSYMGHIQDNAEDCVRATIATLKDGTFELEMDQGCKICVTITVDHTERSAVVDFTGTSAQQPSNFNAPAAITSAAVLYVFRCLIASDIPLNAGCMKPLSIIIPERSMLDPVYPAAVVAGNVEVSQAVTGALFAALGALGSSQGTMNNLTFGNDEHQYYETICSGAPAGPGFSGAAAVHTHMTNSRLTDPEILEIRYPVILRDFAVNRGSGGKGKYTSGDGVIRRIEFKEAMQCAILSGNRRVRLFGVDGGEEGELGRNTIERADGSSEDLGGCGQADVKAGDAVVIVTPTGGGFGEA